MQPSGPPHPGTLPNGERESRSGGHAPFAVYVHWPFCEAKCPYCDFNSHVRHGGVNEARFRTGYLAEIAHMAQLTGPREVASVFFGGGTPSRMRPDTCAAILDAIAGHWTIAKDAEITLEANPTSVEADKFAGFRAAGVNRVSVGLQALNDADLKALGRTHDVKEGLKALQVAHDHFERVSFDLIYARPRQTLQGWRAELAQALKMARGHLSLYQLTIEEGTPFAALQAAGKLKAPGEDLAVDFYEATQELCVAAGLPAYEVSNHAAPGEESRHNLLYWRMGDYAGIGPGAHGRLTIDAARHATACRPGPEDWLEQVLQHGHGMAVKEPLSGPDMADEYLIMGLRLAEGIEIARYEALGGGIDAFTLARLETERLISVRDGRLAATAQGRLLLNAVIAELAG